MIDRGWRRSGTYCYKPDLRTSCCPQYTIRLDTAAFEASKSQRKLINRWTRHVVGDGDTLGTKISSASKPKSSAQIFSLEDALHASEKTFAGDDAVHAFEVTLELSSFTEEKFTLYQSYEASIHKKPNKDRSNFKAFLVDSPLHRQPIPYTAPPADHLPTHYGLHHQMYRLDGRLIGMGIIDILPNCVSSVYFMWEAEFEKFSLGKLSALREISLAREIHNAGMLHMKYLYMGYYIHTCQKMKYKGEYGPSYLADPEDWSWHPLAMCKKLLDRNRYASFAHPDHTVASSLNENERKQTFVGPDLSSEDLSRVYVVHVGQGRPTAILATASPEWTLPEMRQAITACVRALGIELANDIIFYNGL
ncbi:hypothetical protein FA95DRAFT_1556740 [Auriscalpium vulgare]|uniref:Uncharacterized protein n=1 Tax=Auriscalpium vulgare TaxID=40419 RepID=A0ACB8S0X3_9AGAM|nr:hypothetical protein FA95DRAFT_1556740 [Auriscalpium vulgare]